MKLTRAMIIVTLILAMVVGLVTLVGCGTVSIDLHTTVKASGDICQQIKLKGSGMMSTFVTSGEVIQGFREEGWQVNTEHSGDSVCLTAIKDFKRGQAIVLPGLSGEGKVTSLENVHFHIRDLILLKEYFFEVTVPRSPTGIGEDDEFAELSKAILSSMFSMAWTLTLPGKIVETNGDTIDGNSATWYFDLDSLEEGRYMMVHTRYINWPLVSVIGGVIAVGFLIFFVARRRAKYGTS